VAGAPLRRSGARPCQSLRQMGSRRTSPRSYLGSSDLSNSYWNPSLHYCLTLGRKMSPRRSGRVGSGGRRRVRRGGGVRGAYRRVAAAPGRPIRGHPRGPGPGRWAHLDRASLPDKSPGRTGGRIHPWSAWAGVADRGACWPADSRTDWKPMASGTSKAGTHEWLLGSDRQYLQQD